MGHGKLRHINTELIIALCAILVSVASFYATYLQAQAAEKQVKAMTLPLLRLEKSNFDEEQRRVSAQLTINNAGLGPAHIRSLTLHYDGNAYDHYTNYFKACCEAELAAHLAHIKERDYEELTSFALMTQSVTDRYIGGQSKLGLISLPLHEDNDSFFRTLFQVVNQTSAEICYCTMLEDCYLYHSEKGTHPIDVCPVQQEPAPAG